MSNSFRWNPNLTERFAQKFNVRSLTECWPWTANQNNKGYGQLRRGNTLVLAHRQMWEFERGPIPDMLCVLHTCDNPLCVNPSHLFLGTRADNNRDARAKGRTPAGEKQWMAKLTADQVRQIRAADGTCKTLGKQFGVSPSQISRIKRKERWSHESK